MFSELTDDIILKVLWKLEDDPRDWARISCVSTRFRSLIHQYCWKKKCFLTIPSELLSIPDPSLHKLPFCCPGPLHAGLLFEEHDLLLDYEPHPHTLPSTPPHLLPPQPPQPHDSSSSSSWSLYDDLYHDTLYATSEPHIPNHLLLLNEVREGVDVTARGFRKRKLTGSVSSHLASGKWTLSREQGNKLLARQFRDDCLYVCDWPGCVHSVEGKRKYRVFRGIFKNFKRTRVWRTVNDCTNTNRSSKKLDLPCAFCSCDHTWDLHSAFCLRRGFGFHDDGEPVVRAYVCDNGHVSGAWTDVPMYI